MWDFVFIGAGICTLVYGIGLVREARACAQWPRVEGEVVRAEAQVLSREKNRVIYAPNVTYRYGVVGKSHESSRLTLTPRNYPSLSQVEAVLGNYPAGRKVSVHYDPTDPANCLLELGSNGTEWAYPIGGVLLIGVGLLFFRQR